MVANTLTNLLPDAYKALDVVSREQIGMIPAVMVDADVSRLAVGETLYSGEAPASTASDITAGTEVPNTGDQTIGAVSATINKARSVQFRWNGEQTRHVNAGQGVLSLQQNQIAQAMRTLVNEMESDLTALHTGFSRAYGTAGTTPFGTAGDFTDATETLRILKDNGAPTSDNHLIVGSAAGAKLLGKQSRADIAGDVQMQRQGIFYEQSGLSVRESGQIGTFTKGTGASATTDNAGYAIGATVLTLASAGTGTLLAGDVVTFAGDTNKYVIASGDADVSGGGTITLTAPGLRVAMSAATKAITVVATSTRNMAFTRSAIILGTRLPSLPEAGDKAVDRTTIIDPRSGISFELALYPGFRVMNYWIGAAWGANLMKPAHTALLLG